MTVSGTSRVSAHSAGRETRPTSTDPQQLGFTPAKPTHWLSPSMLANTAVRVVLSDVFGEFLDKRDLQAALPSRVHDERPDASGHGDIWFDFVADLGDGFNATYTIAHLLAQDELTVDAGDGEVDLPRGAFLLMGGDEVYPTPSVSRYKNQTKGPYQAAMPVPPEGRRQPNLYALPGNHDWYDGLSNFTRLFLKDGKDHLGGWRNAQARSYFAIQLPHRWWVFAVDTQFGAYIDDAQLAYFHEAAALIDEGDRVILASATPSWVEAVEDPGVYDALDFFMRTVLVPTGADVKLMLSGDLHHYARYEAEDGSRQLVHCGGGGAYLYPTHRMPEEIPVPPPAPAPRAPKASEPTRKYRLASTFPSKARSRAYAGGVFWRLPLGNTGFVGLLGTLQTLLMLSLVGLLGHPGTTERRWLELPAALMILTVMTATILFAKSPTGGSRNNGRRLFLGFVHGLVQLALGFAATWAWHEFPYGHSHWPLPILTTLGYLVVTGLVSTLIFCAYLLLASALNVNVNELFSAQSIIDSKSFLRLHIDARGTLTIYVIGVPKVSRKWRANPAGEVHEPWLEPTKPVGYHLVEPPIIVA